MLYEVITELADDATKSFYTKRLHRVKNPPTIADGTRTPSLGKITFPLVLEYVDEMKTVPEKAIIEAVKFLFYRMKLVVEPSGALVITSYSIHYTKLYDTVCRHMSAFLAKRLVPVPGSDSLLPIITGLFYRHGHIPFTPRITSYNVCYTKLLRIYAPHLTLWDQKPHRLPSYVHLFGEAFRTHTRKRFLFVDNHWILLRTSPRTGPGRAPCQQGSR